MLKGKRERVRNYFALHKSEDFIYLKILFFSVRACLKFYFRCILFLNISLNLIIYIDLHFFLPTCFSLNLTLLSLHTYKHIDIYKVQQPHLTHTVYVATIMSYSYVRLYQYLLPRTHLVYNIDALAPWLIFFFSFFLLALIRRFLSLCLTFPRSVNEVMFFSTFTFRRLARKK